MSDVQSRDSSFSATGVFQAYRVWGGCELENKVEPGMVVTNVRILNLASHAFQLCCRSDSSVGPLWIDQVISLLLVSVSLLQ